MMDKYIKNKALLNALKEERKNGNFVFTSKWIKEIIDNLPAADVVEVKHGEWITPTKIKSMTIPVPHCSLCGNVPCDKALYCPYCGAKMDLKEGTEE